MHAENKYASILVQLNVYFFYNARRGTIKYSFVIHDITLRRKKITTNFLLSVSLFLKNKVSKFEFNCSEKLFKKKKML